MPFNGSGAYSPPAANYPAVSITLITAANRNAVDADIASALSTAICKDGQTTITGNLPMSGFRHTGVANSNAKNTYASSQDVQDGTIVYLTSVGGTANAITATAANGMTAYAAGQRFRFIVGTTNTAPATITINGIAGGAKNITKFGALPLSAGELLVTAIADIVYDGTQFQLLSSAPLGQNQLGVFSVDLGNSGTSTQDLNYQTGAVKRIKATGNFTITTSNWPATGNMGEMLLRLVADGTGRTITYTLGSGTTNFVKTDGSFATTPALSGVTMQTTNDAIDFVYMWSFNAGVTVYAKVLR